MRGTKENKREGIGRVDKNMFLTALNIHPSWEGFFEREDVRKELEEIEGILSNVMYTPLPHQVLRFATLDIQSILVIVLGRDPYPQQLSDGRLVATGRAFEVNGATTWFDKVVNPSLKNMVKLMHKTYQEKEVGAPIQEVRESIADGTFQIPTPDKAFAYWEGQGVLFLNTAFTCEVGTFQQSGSHIKLWKRFFNLLLTYLAEKNPKISYFLWGEARKQAKVLEKSGIKKEFLYGSKHPCTNGDVGGYGKEGAFLNNPCFHDTKKSISWIYPTE